MIRFSRSESSSFTVLALRTRSIRTDIFSTFVLDCACTRIAIQPLVTGFTFRCNTGKVYHCSHACFASLRAFIDKSGLAFASTSHLHLAPPSSPLLPRRILVSPLSSQRFSPTMLSSRLNLALSHPFIFVSTSWLRPTNTITPLSYTWPCLRGKEDEAEETSWRSCNSLTEGWC